MDVPRSANLPNLRCGEHSNYGLHARTIPADRPVGLQQSAR